MTDVTVREATGDDLAAVLGVLDAAALETDYDRVRESVGRGETLVAVRGGAEGSRESRGDADGEREPDAPILGALVLVDDRIDAVAVRPGRRGQGIGTALVEGAARRRDRLVAAFDADVRPFYDALGFDVEPAEEPGRYRGLLRADGS